MLFRFETVFNDKRGDPSGWFFEEGLGGGIDFPLSGGLLGRLLDYWSRVLLAWHRHCQGNYPANKGPAEEEIHNVNSLPVGLAIPLGRE